MKDMFDSSASFLVAYDNRVAECEIVTINNALNEKTHLSSIDILITNVVCMEPSPVATFNLYANSEPQQFLSHELKQWSSGCPSKEARFLVRYLFSHKSGYSVRADILDRRLECCSFVKSVCSFLKPGTKISPPSHHHKDLEIPLQFLDEAIGALSLEMRDTQSVKEVIEALNEAILDRFSFDWCLPSPPARRRVGWVQGRQDYESIGRAYEGARAMDITLVIFDESGHWMEDENGPYAYLREAFVPLSIQVDEGLVDRLVDAVRQYPHQIDGLVTVSDPRLPAIAAACEILGLPTEPFTAFAAAGDKGTTRSLEMTSSDEPYLVVSSSEDLRSQLDVGTWKPSFPLIVKPTLGWNSDCVVKCNNESELIAAVERASARHMNSPMKSTTVVIESYISGPEVDANIVLLDGEILFFEAEDDFPSTADAEVPSSGANFMETQVVIPSKLPRDELQMLRASMKASILRQGFRSGVFHCEARVRNSKAHYVKRDGILDLELRTDKDDKSLKPSMYLHEINARPPGYLESVAVLLSYGIDFYAIRILLSLGLSEHSRIRALCQPFRCGPQFSLSMTILPAMHSGIMRTEDAVLDLFKRYPELRENVVNHNTAKKRGDLVQGPESQELWWIAYLSVISRTGRADLLSRVQFIRDNFRYEVE